MTLNPRLLPESSWKANLSRVNDIDAATLHLLSSIPYQRTFEYTCSLPSSSHPRFDARPFSSNIFQQIVSHSCCNFPVCPVLSNHVAKLVSLHCLSGSCGLATVCLRFAGFDRTLIQVWSGGCLLLVPCRFLTRFISGALFEERENGVGL